MTEISLPHLSSGKVRDIYDAGDDRLLLVTSDRMSAFDVVMAEPIPDKGRVLTAMSAFWFEQLGDVVAGHLISTDLADLPPEAQDPALAGRVMLCRKAEMLPIECIVRGYLTGSAWKEYRASGTMHGTRVAGGAARVVASCPSRCSPRRPRPRSASTTSTSPSTRRSSWSVPSSRRRPATSASSSTARGAAWAAERGIIIADTKFELGLIDGELVLADEVLTPDSSRFWPADEWEPGTTPPSFDKQPVRDYLDGLDWDKTPPPPPLPAEVVDATRDRYVRGLRAHHRSVVRRLAGRRDLTRTRGRRRGSGAVAAVCDHGPMRFSVQVEVSLRAGVADPQGATIERSLPHLGFDGVDGVRVGKMIRFDARGRRPGSRRGRGGGPVRAVPHQPGHRGQHGHGHRGGVGLMAPRVGVVLFPGSNCEQDAIEAIRDARRRRRRPLARRRQRRRRSTRSSSPAGSPTATTSGPAPSPGSPR